MSASDVVGRKFYGKFADGIANCSAPRWRDIKAQFDNGSVSVDWKGTVVSVTFYYEDFNSNLPKAVVHTKDKVIGIISSDSLGSLCEIIFWIDFSLSRVIDR